MTKKNIFLTIISLALIVSTGCLNSKSGSEKKEKADGDRQIQTITADKKSTDTLTGTTVLKASEKNMTSRWEHGLFLESVSSTECKNSDQEHPTPTEIVSIEQADDNTLLINANVNANCGYSFLGEIEVVGGNTINLISHGYGSYADCSCCFGLTYKIEIMRDEDISFDKLKYVTINGLAKKNLPKIR
jgi:hypothetical protein